ncbi:transposase IS204/IS1001/IS1096/IS1165 family protein [Paenibacillus algicola]|uniref:Transposase IS204/IS1001/IS1096/IS1165 family protein n=1 Tax=Paenibacillus algicola TaxID=2565926 RepID=A0A4P8XH19_9BACL|nr:transposase IS204/IS1001/IS1096/IS1165 family protein [Paenibacillus algicola]
MLNTQAEWLGEEGKKRLNTLLNYAPILRCVWEWKEAFTTWYDCSPGFSVAKLGFERWCEQGHRIDHDAVRSTLKTMSNWKEEIMNYHKCR